MSNKYKESMAEKYKKAIEMEISLQCIKYLRRRTVSKLENCYDIQLIRKGFQAYFQNTVSKEYFLN